MTIDREQIRRDAESVQPDKTRFTAGVVLALLAELEQAEKGYDDATGELATELAEARTEANVLEARLAKVPALVEAAHKAIVSLEDEVLAWTAERNTTDHVVAIQRRLARALTDYEGETA